MTTINKIIDGKMYAEKLLGEIHPLSKGFLDNFDRKPCLTVILVGDNPASKIYVKNKILIAKKIGIESNEILLGSDVTEDELIHHISILNKDENVDGILVQLPLPKHILEKKIINIICPSKDVDGFHPKNFGKLFMGDPKFIPCTPLGCLYMLKHEIEDIKGKNAVIIGRSNIVGKPMASLLLSSDCSVTITHSKTKNIEKHARKADILIIAVGIPEMIDEKFIKPGAVVIDVGINRSVSKTNDNSGNKGKLVGDVKFENVLKIAKKITPVPGGVGPMTIACLMHNTVKAAYINKKNDFINVLEGIL
ncbi:MAG: bifunctional methylenetetrahydrofolate dehydrogenase/methenyltetrahydrofolate cyclohydrolase [Rhodospirillaceae bacterium]|nr:bifunctional methylenetetrahydrofolate dehydrogenase/methenyltetrahydrofolate cyclohydrolase [Rhodospirillaceae bacterium]